MKYINLRNFLIIVACLGFLILVSQVKDVQIVPTNGTDLPIIQRPSATSAPTKSLAPATAFSTSTRLPTYTPRSTSTPVVPTPLADEQIFIAWQAQIALATPIRTPVVPVKMEKFPKLYIQDGNLYYQNSENQLAQLTNSGKDRDPVLSDDGQKIVFFRAESIDKLYSINSDGSKEKALVTGKTPLLIEKGEIKSPTFVPGRHLVLFNTYLCSPSKGLYVYPECVIGLYAIDADTREINKIVENINGNSQRDRNFEVSPDGKYVSVAGAGSINIYSLSSGRFKTAYPNVMTYYITSNSEYLPKQYWLQDSSELIMIRAADGEGNDPAGSPFFYDVFRYNIGEEQAAQLQLDKFLMHDYRLDTWCISPDRNWILFAGNDTGEMRDDSLLYYLGNLTDGHTQPFTPFRWSLDCKWSSDSRHFSFTFDNRPGLIGSIDKPPIPVGGSFMEWIDSTHYYYTVGEKTYIGEISGD